ncbi:MAG: hypothetical protein BM557_07085 [Flavobacterium sp. MedPE-SWcel]|uniref:hypothetical protein n=1 Tax=uncultured Flavobacterium sp. TaxID=165435 RepID=UPI00090FA62B|nr:hypothetical protein [uncultured Flavobacterium sp.]OIQ18678.1 MAG: hypothetical protein BM557_07085 [Flavobacterium sp. MedPE-SWcel]
MKFISSVVLLLLLVSCVNKTKNVDDSKAEAQEKQYLDTLPNSEIKKQIIFGDDTLRISEKVFNRYQKYFNEINQHYIQNPETAHIILSGGCLTGYEDLSYEFTSEVGEDVYYLLYSHFLKQNNGDEEYKEERENLIKIFQNINTIYGYLNYGGTYFGHQKDRIYGKTEYAIYLYHKNKNDYEKKYTIDKQKKLYTDRLRQLVLDEEKYDYYTLSEEKIERRKKIMNFINQLDILIINFFYLRQAEEFEHSNYITILI